MKRIFRTLYCPFCKKPAFKLKVDNNVTIHTKKLYFVRVKINDEFRNQIHRHWTETIEREGRNLEFQYRLNERDWSLPEVIREWDVPSMYSIVCDNWKSIDDVIESLKSRALHRKECIDANNQIIADLKELKKVVI